MVSLQLKVLEETGFDISGLIEEEYIEATFNEQLARLYVVTNVPVETDFKPKTRGEIKVSILLNVKSLNHTCFPRA